MRRLDIIEKYEMKMWFTLLDIYKIKTSCTTFDKVFEKAFVYFGNQKIHNVDQIIDFLTKFDNLTQIKILDYLQYNEFIIEKNKEKWVSIYYDENTFDTCTGPACNSKKESLDRMMKTLREPWVYIDTIQLIPNHLKEK